MKTVFLRVILPYGIFAGLWILLSDLVLASLVRDPVLLTRLSMFKGWGFVLVTALLLYSTLRVECRRREGIEADLRRSEQRLNGILEAVPDGIAQVNGSGQITFANAAAEAFLGLTRSSLLDRRYNDPRWQSTTMDGRPFPEEDLPFTQVMRRQGPVFGIEQVLRRADGRPVALRINAAPLRDASGAVCGMVAAFTDITQQKRTEEEIRRQNLELAALNETGQALSRLAEPRAMLELVFTMVGRVLDNRNLCIALHDPRRGAVTFPVHTIDGERQPESGRPLSPGLTEHILRTQMPLLLSRDVEAGLKSRGIERLSRPCRSLMGVPLLAGDRALGAMVMQDFEREEAYAESHLKLLTLIAAQAAGALENARLYAEAQEELAERRRTAEALRVSQNLLAEILDTMPQSVFWKDRDSVYRGCNRPFAQAVGLSHPEEVQGKTDYDLPWPRSEAETYREDDRQVMESGRPKRDIVEPLQQADGTRLWIQTTKLPLRGADAAIVGVLGVFEDVTERRRTEEALRESRQMLQTVLDTIPVRVFWKDLHLRYLGCNRAFLADAGVASLEFLVGKTDVELGWTPQAEGYQADDLAVIRTGQAKLGFEEPQTKPDGGRLWLRTSKVPLRAASGHVYGVLGTYEDITEARQAELARQESESRIRAILEHAPFGAHSYELRPDDQLVLVHANPAADRILGIDHTPLLGRTLETAFPGLVRTEIPQTYRRVATAGETFVTEQIDYDEGRIRGAYEVHAFGTGAGRMTVFFRDVTKRRRAEEALRQSEERFRALVETTSDWVWETDAQGAYIYVSPKVRDLLGYEPGEILGRSPFDLMPGDEARRMAVLFRDLAERRKPLLAVQNTNRRKDGSLVILETNGVPILGPSGDLLGYRGIDRDITQRIEAERRVREQERFISAVAHTSPDFLVVFDLGTRRPVYQNRDVAEFLGHSAQGASRVEGDALRPLLHPDDQPRLREHLQRIGQAEDHELLGIEYRMRRSDGTYAWFFSRDRVFLRGADGRVQQFLSVTQDVTERKRAQEALEQRTEELDRFFTVALDLLCIADTEGRFRRLNPQWARVLGYSLAELENRRFLDFVHPEDEAGTRKALGELSTQKSVLDFVNRYRCKDGSYRWIEWRSFPAGDRVYAAARDITEHRRTEAELRETEYFLNRSQQIARIGSYKFEIATDVWTSSPSLDEIFGIDASYPRTVDGWLGLVAEADRDRLRDHLLRQVLGERHRFDQEYRIIRFRDRAERWVRGLGELEFDARDLPRRMIGTIQDITDRRAAERALAESERKYRELVQNANSIILRWNPDGRITFINEFGQSFFGYTEAELLGRHVLGTLVPETDSAGRDLGPLMAQICADPKAFENNVIENQCRDGRRVWIAWTNKALFDAHGHLVEIFSVGTDITERRRAEQQVHELNLELERRVESRTAELAAANAELEAFCYSVSHDLRAPLRAIHGFSQALKEDCAPRLDPLGRDYLGRVQSASRRMEQLIDDLLRLSRVTRVALHPTRVDLSALAASVRDELQATQPERRLEWDIEPGLSAEADPGLIRIVLENLLGNAWKFTRESHAPRIEFGSGVEEGRLVFFVRDNGAGFDIAYAGKLFSPFQRLHSPDRFEGTGIGLATVQRILHRHGGRAWAQGAVNQGAIFHFTIPDR